MKNNKAIFIKIFLFFVLVASSTLAQTPKDDTIPSPVGYTNGHLRASSLAYDASDNKWVAFNTPPISPTGLFKLDATKVWTAYDTTNSPLPHCMIRSLACNTNGVWAGTDSGLYNYNGTAWKWYKTTNSNIPNDTVLNLYSAGGNELWIYSKKGFVYFNGTTFKQYNTSNSGLVNDTVKCIFKSSTGTWWIGTIHGLSSFDGTSWKSYTRADKLYCDDNIIALNEDKNAVIFIGTSYGQLLAYDGRFFTNMGEYSAGSVGTIYRLQDGRILTTGNSVEFIITTNPISVITKSAGYYTKPYTTITSTAFVMDKADRIWRININPPLGKLIFSDSLLFYPTSVPSTVPENNKYNFLDANEVKCWMRNNNDFFSVTNNSFGGYYVPKNSCGGRSALFMSTMWIGGLDSNSKLHLSAQTYRQSGTDFWPGPLDSINAQLDSVTFVRYDSLWKVNRDTIDEFKTQYQLGNVSSGAYKIPNIIRNWPAHGTGSYTRNLAPFVDYNADGIYNPLNGDYPKIEGDQMLWWVMNDNLYTDPYALNLGVEIQSKAYAHSCQSVSSNEEAINYTTFYSDSIINRSDTDYHDVYIGIWVDPDLGYYLDDYIGCRIDGDYAFAYNGDNNDDGVAGYGENPPMISIAILKGPKAEPGDGLDNNHDGTIDEPGETCMMNHFQYYSNDNSSNGNPDVDLEYYNYMKSIWRDGTHVTFGGNGHGSGCGTTTIPTDYMFSGMPYDTGWTEASACNAPDDRRFLMSSGPFSLPAHESKTLDYAIVFSWYKTAPNGLNTSVAKNDADVRKIKHWFETDSFPCKNSSIGIREIEKNNNGLFIYPNPAQGQYTLVFKGASKAEMELLDITGRIVKQQTVFANQKNIIDVHGVAKGMYVVRVKDGEGAVAKRIIID